ncbi:hypothetical protein STENM223S_08820 [Streptomyces tendae]
MVVYLRAPDEGDEPLERAYREISWVRPRHRPGTAQQRSVPHLQFGPDHQDNPSALRPFQDRSRGRHYAVYGIASEDV